MVITFIALIFLNIYCSITCEQLFHDNKENTLTDRVQLAATELAKLEQLNTDSVSTTLNRISSLKANRLLVTTTSGDVIYDTDSENATKNILLPEMKQALEDAVNGDD